ncbi:acyltransferase family protein [Bradyrhizobium ganzhouense]|uniref:acyltransferase family protein n=1 Tax=Bradyrhizobium ganzhouense TaxID=1179767 RepID=UPI003CF28789
MHASNRLPALDGLRAISILLVLATHMLPLGPKFLRLNETAGAMGMSLFFALSGFLIASLLMRNDDVVEFLVKRLMRILPLAYAYALIVFSAVKFDPASMFWTMSFVENYFSSHLSGFNSHFWSLCVEIHFYIAIALIVAIAGKRGIWAVWPACFAVTAIRVSQGAYIDIQTHLRVDEILAGACVATLFERGLLNKFRYDYLLLTVACLLWLASSSPYMGWLQYSRPYASAVLLAGVLGHQGSYLSTFLSSAPMRYLATISYALYVIHQATIQGWMNEGSIFERYFLKRPISLATTFALAHLSTFHWERAWLNAGRQFIQQRRMRRCLPAPAREAG